jgi:hypothetical protein
VQQELRGLQVQPALELPEQQAPMDPLAHLALQDLTEILERQALLVRRVLMAQPALRDPEPQAPLDRVLRERRDLRVLRVHKDSMDWMEPEELPAQRARREPPAPQEPRERPVPRVLKERQVPLERRVLPAHKA